MKNRNRRITTIFLALGSLALSPIAQAVSPAPDGGYPGGNTAEGQNALLSISTGTYNTAVGIFSLLSNTDGTFCTAVGAGALLANTAESNTGIGAGALLSNTTAEANTALGGFALFSNTTGEANTAIGINALQKNITGELNTATGSAALFNNISGGANTGTGEGALIANTTGSGNTAIGLGALSGITTGNFNTAIGENAGDDLTTSDSNNIDIGVNVHGVAGESNTIRIGSTEITDTFIRGISGTTVASGDAVFVASNGHLGTITSSRRFKQDITAMDKASEALFALKPVTFRYKKEIDPAGTSQFGLVAEEVEKVNPDLVTRDENGRVNSVRYDKVNAMLLNEFLKEHRKVEEQEATIAQLKSTLALQRKDFEGIAAQQQKEIQTLIAGFREQAAQIQRVSAQMEVSKAGPGVVTNQLRKVEPNASSQ